jgi:O-methyltransferase domain
MPTSTPAPTQLLHMVTGYYVPQMLYVVASLGIADLLIRGARSLDDLAVTTHTHAPSLVRLLRALASVEIFAENAQGYWQLTPLADGLRSDVPHSQRAWVQLYGGIQQRAWQDLLYSVQTGQPAFPHVFGASFYDYLASHPDDAALVDTAMDHSVDVWLATIPTSTAWDNVQMVMDIGGGHGALLAQLLTAHPHLDGILFDLPHVIAGAAPILERAGVLHRCRILGGDMFASIPSGSDMYVLSRVLLNWDDAHCLAILRNCRQALGADGRLLIIDAVASDGTLESGVALWDVFLLVIFGARVRRSADFEALLHAADLQLLAIHATPSQFSIIEAQPQ